MFLRVFYVFLVFPLNKLILGNWKGLFNTVLYLSIIFSLLSTQSERRMSGSVKVKKSFWCKDYSIPLEVSKVCNEISKKQIRYQEDKIVFPVCYI